MADDSFATPPPRLDRARSELRPSGHAFLSVTFFQIVACRTPTTRMHLTATPYFVVGSIARFTALSGSSSPNTYPVHDNSLSKGAAGSRGGRNRFLTMESEAEPAETAGATREQRNMWEPQGLEAVKKVLKLHLERKYHEKVLTASQLVLGQTEIGTEQTLPDIVPSLKTCLQRTDRASTILRSESKGDSSYFDYYTINKSNVLPEEYFAINQDVSSFAKNYARVRQILKVTRNRGTTDGSESVAIVKSSARPRKRLGYIKVPAQKLSVRSQSVNEAPPAESTLPPVLKGKIWAENRRRTIAQLLEKRKRRKTSSDSVVSAKHQDSGTKPFSRFLNMIRVSCKQSEGWK